MTKRMTTRLKELILAERILVMPGAHDAMAARLAESAGFDAVTLGGYPATASLLGKPDLSILTLPEMATHTRNIVEAVSIPVFTDGDTGYGNVTNVIRTVREFEKTGVAGMFIEDQIFPKRCGHMEGKRVVPPAEMTAKIRAATDTRIDPDFVLMARTDALAVEGIDAAIERACRYREAGADLIFVEAPETRAEMIRINQEIDAPTMANMIEGGKSELLTAGELEEIGYNVVVFPISTLYAAAHAVRETLATLKKTGTTREKLSHMISFAEFNELMGLGEIRRRESRYYQEIVNEEKTTKP